MIKRKEMQELVSSYKGKPTIVIFGSHSAIETGLSSRKMGLKNIVVVKKGRERQYLEEQSHLFDEAIVVNDWKDMLDDSIQKKLREKNGLVDACERLQGINNLGIVKFSSEDIVRNPIVSEIEDRYKISE